MAIVIGAGMRIGAGMAISSGDPLRTEGGGGGGGGPSYPLTFTYVNQSSVLNNDSILGFKPDGTLVTTLTSGGALQSYTLSTPWDITSMGSATTVNIGSYFSNPDGMFGPTWNDTGTEINLVITPDYSDFYAAKLALGTAWDITSATTGTIAGSALSQARAITAFNDTGTKAYQFGGGQVRQYNLGSAYAWSAESGAADASYDLYSNLSLGGYPFQIAFSSDGLIGVVFDIGAAINGVITQFQLGTAYDVSTIVSGTAQSTSLSIGIVYTDKCGCYMSPDNTKLYVTAESAFGQPRIYQFSIA